MLEVCRYVDLNPVRANMVPGPSDYLWSSYRALAGLANKPAWLDARSVYDQIASGKTNSVATLSYKEFLLQGRYRELWHKHLKQQTYLGDDDFINRMQRLPGLTRKVQTNKASRVNLISAKFSHGHLWQAATFSRLRSHITAPNPNETEAWSTLFTKAGIPKQRSLWYLACQVLL